MFGSKIQEYLKFVGPALAALAMCLITAVNTGHFDIQAVETGLVALAAAVVSLVVTNTRAGVARYMKATAPAFLTLVGVGIHTAVTGEFNEQELRIATSGLMAAMFALVLPNISLNTGRNVQAG